MKSVLKYGFRLGGNFVPPGTEVEILSVADPRVTENWPNMKSNPESRAVAIQVQGYDRPTLVHYKELAS